MDIHISLSVEWTEPMLACCSCETLRPGKSVASWSLYFTCVVQSLFVEAWILYMESWKRVCFYNNLCCRWVLAVGRSQPPVWDLNHIIYKWMPVVSAVQQQLKKWCFPSMVCVSALIRTPGLSTFEGSGDVSPTSDGWGVNEHSLTDSPSPCYSNCSVCHVVKVVWQMFHCWSLHTRTS